MFISRIVRKVRETLSIRIEKNPSRAILLVILALNLVFILAAAMVISKYAPPEMQGARFRDYVYYTISMILDAGCISYVIEHVGEASTFLIILCLAIVIIGMIIFTGAVIGYVTNYISSFIENTNKGVRQLKISNHTVILNWNSRAAEIVNDLLYSERPEKVVVLVPGGKDIIEKEVQLRLKETTEKEHIRNNITFIVREGETYSLAKLNDIAIKKAKSIVLLSNLTYDELGNDFETDEKSGRKRARGNYSVIKTLIQVAELTALEDSNNDQKIVVEVEDVWTQILVDRIIANKERLGKSNIVTVPVNKILGQILSQFTIMPELNWVYSELFSNKGAEFFSRRCGELGDDEYISDYLRTHMHAIPLTGMEVKEGRDFFYVGTVEADIDTCDPPCKETGTVRLNKEFWFEKKNIIILGHNSKMQDVMNAFNLFRAEWNLKYCPYGRRSDEEILDIKVIDDAASLERYGHYNEYPYVTRTEAVDLFDGDTIRRVINEYLKDSKEDTSILILSDDEESGETQDMRALTYLIHVRDLIREKVESNPLFDLGSIDVIVEILNPRNYDIVSSYSINNIIISNRYISRMITQIGDKEAMYDFYSDILTYDEEGADEYVSKELYIKKVAEFFEEVPEEMSAAALIRAVYQASPENNRSIVLGYVDAKGNVYLFSGDQRKHRVALKNTDKIIVFANH